MISGGRILPAGSCCGTEMEVSKTQGPLFGSIYHVGALLGVSMMWIIVNWGLLGGPLFMDTLK